MRLIWIMMAFALAAPARAQQKQRPLLWQVKGERPSVLLGLADLGISADKVLPAGVFRRIDRCESYVTEADIRNVISQQLTPHLVLPKGQSLDRLLGVKTWERLTERVGDLSAEDLKRYRPWVLSQMLMPAEFTRGTPMRRALLERAARARRKLVFLETVLSQVKGANALPLKKLAGELADEIDHPEAYRKRLREQAAAYRAGDLSRLARALRPAPLVARFPEFYTQFIDKRTGRWLAAIEARLKEGNAFIAVDAGHLLGQAGLLALLRAKGYEIVRIEQ